MEILGLGLVGAGVLGASCGLRVFLAPFVVCLLASLGGIGAESGSWLTSQWAAGLAMVFLVIELGGDKLPGVDQALDAAGLVLRPAWAVGVVLATVPGDGALAAAGVAALGALVIGLGKARLRAEARDAFSGEMGPNAVMMSPVLSLVEDVVAGVTVLGALVIAPLAAVGLVGVAVGLHVAAQVVHRRRWQALIAAASP